MRRARGFSLLELVVSIVVITLVVTLLYTRYLALAADAEVAAVRGVVGWLQAGVNVRVSLSLTRGDLSDLAALEGSNPMALADAVVAPPPNYLGPLSGSAAEQAEPGNWYFHPDRGLLVYRFRYSDAAASFGLSPGDRLGFRLKVRRGAADNGGREQISGLELVAEKVPPA